MLTVISDIRKEHRPNATNKTTTDSCINQTSYSTFSFKTFLLKVLFKEFFAQTTGKKTLIIGWTEKHIFGNIPRKL